MFRTIVVPLDGSLLAEHALPLAVDLARQARAAVRLVAVHRRDLGDPAADLAVIRTEQGYLDKTAATIRQTGVRSVTTELLEEGSVAPALCAYARAVAADLIVLTTHGRGPVSRFWLGSVADVLLRSSPVPLLLHRPVEGVTPARSSPVAIRRVLVPVDGRVAAESALVPAVELARLFGADLLLFRAVVPAPVLIADGTAAMTSAMEGPVLKELVNQARADLARIARQLRVDGLSVDTDVAVNVSPAIAVLDSAPRVDLIVLATHGRGQAAQFFLGSVADKVVRGAPCPVFVVRNPSTAGDSP